MSTLYTQEKHEIKGRLGYGSQRALSSDEKHARFHNTIDIVEVHTRNRIMNNELLSDAEIMSLPKDLIQLDSILETQLAWRQRPDFEVHLAELKAIEAKKEEHRMEMKNSNDRWLASKIQEIKNKCRQEGDDEDGADVVVAYRIGGGGGGGGGGGEYI